METSLKNNKDGDRSRGETFWLSKAFSRSFLRPVYPSRVQVKFKGKQQQQQEGKKTVFIVFLGLKDFGGFKDRQERVTRKH